MELPQRETSSEQVRVLMLRKDAIEAEIDTQASILRANNVTMQSPLIDPEGFPRADIDIWEVRHARVRIIELRNDLRDVMDSIMKGLQGVYNPALVEEKTESPAPNPFGLHPFARVDDVAPGSPAAAAVSFGDNRSEVSHIDPHPTGPLERRFDFVFRDTHSVLVHRELTAVSRSLRCITGKCTYNLITSVQSYSHPTA